MTALCITKCLEQLGYAVSSVVPSGEEAVSRVFVDTPDLVLMDIFLSGRMDGIEAARHIREYLPVIYLTSLTDEEILDRAKMTEPFGYLLKPVDRDKLHISIEMALYKAKMEEKLRTSEERYRTLVEKMNEGVVIIDEHRVITYVNEKLCKILGYTSDQILGTSFENYFDPINLQEVKKQWAGRQRGEPGTYEISGCRADGIRFHVLVSSTPIFDKKGVFRGSSAVVTDITVKQRAEKEMKKAHDDLEQKVLERTADLNAANIRLTREIEERIRMEAALRDSELNLQHIYDNSPVMMHSIDEQGVVCRINQHWLDTTGHRREEVLGRSICFLMTPESARRAFTEVLPQLLAEGHVRNVPYQFIKKDGTLMEVMLDCEMTEDPGGDRISLSVVRDITEQNRVQREIWEAKRLLRAVVDGISDPLVMVDRDMKILMLNSAALKYYRLPEYQVAVGHPCFEVLTEEKVLCRRCAVPSAIEEGRYVSFERKGLYDAFRIEQVVVYPVEDAAVELSGGILRITDLTDKKKVDEQLIRADRLSSLGQLSAGIAHEIRNPLSGISLFADILSDLSKFDRTEQELDIIQEIKSNVGKINQIIKRVLDFARHGDSTLTEIDINQLLREVLMLWYSRMRNKRVKVDIRLEDSLPPIMGDAIGIQQVMNNLIQNAVDAMADGGDLTLSTVQRSSAFQPDKPMVIVTVADTGPGIEADASDRIFDPFFTTKAGGTGLGLSISFQILERQGGFIYFNSEPGQGTAFTVELPIRR